MAVLFAASSWDEYSICFPTMDRSFWITIRGGLNSYFPFLSVHFIVFDILIPDFPVISALCVLK